MDEEPAAPVPQVIPPGFRLHNGVLVPAEQPAITRIVPRPKPKPDPWRRWVLVGAAVLFVVIVVAARSAQPDPRVQPADERTFLGAVQHGQDRVRGGNAVTQVAARAERARSMCRLLAPRHWKVQGWLGTIHDIDTTGGDQGVITVSLGHDTDLRTGSGLGADQRTLLHPGSGVFDSVATLHNGEQVVVGGTFVREPHRCVRETSLFARNGMLSPDFLFLFTSIAPA